MSRCFPFPPPGYAGKCPDNEALILSIKLQRENEKANSDREREKRKSLDKKERRKEKKKERKKEKERSKHSSNGGKEKLLEKLYQADNNKAPRGDKLISTLGQCESELVEKSTVTEEHGQPIDLQIASCSSDSTGNSSKRKRPSTPPGSIQSHGSILRIRFSSSQKTEEPSTSGRIEQGSSVSFQKKDDLTTSRNSQPCSNLQRRKEESSINLKDVNLLQANLNFPSVSNAALQPSTSGQKDQKVLVLHEKKVKSEPQKEKLSSHEKKMLKKEAKYKKLFESWVPVVYQTELPALPVYEDDDGDWLFGNKAEEKPAKRLKASDPDMSNKSVDRCATAALQPRAQYLPDVEMYALPYTVPF